MLGQSEVREKRLRVMKSKIWVEKMNTGLEEMK